MAYSSKELCQRAGITPRQMDHWQRRGWIRPFDRTSQGSGVPMEWPTLALKKATLMGRLGRTGIGPQRAHEIATTYLSYAPNGEPCRIRLEIGIELRITLRDQPEILTQEIKTGPVYVLVVHDFQEDVEVAGVFTSQIAAEDLRSEAKRRFEAKQSYVREVTLNKLRWPGQ
jgi:hypothetical protein